MSKNHSILIISSYNPDAHPTSANISEFMDEYHKLNGKDNVIIENMNCKSFSDFLSWKAKMKQLLLKYHSNKKPKVLILLGQEAWTSYLSQSDSLKRGIPTLCCMVSRNAILLPDKRVDLKKWMPKSIDSYTDSLRSHLRAGFMYQYDVVGNINLIKKMYPKTRNIAFVSDNTYGGVSLQAYVRQEMKKFPDLNLILLDGRSNTLYTIVEKLRNLPPNTSILLGSWKVDMNEGYFVRNAVYVMKDATPTTPVFSLSQVGFGYWAIGGVMPNYHIFGRELARQVIKMHKYPSLKTPYVQLVRNKLIFDYNIIKDRNIDLSIFADRFYEFINEPVSFYTEYKYLLLGIGVCFTVLLVGLFVSLFFYFRTKRLKDTLLESEAELRLAKDRAEESNKLKTAFLANMSHEIRTPLNAIVGFSEVLLDLDSSSGEDRENYVDIIKTNSDLLLRLINDIIDVSKLETDKVLFEYVNSDIVIMCRQILISLDFIKKSNNKFIFSSDLDSFEMKVDLNRMQQVLFNILSNANKYTEFGRVTISFVVYEKYVEFSVADTGCGIPEDKQDLVFERFSKLNEYTQGVGLGLSICQLIVDKWGGEIWVDKEYHDGTRIVFTHPII